MHMWKYFLCHDYPGAFVMPLKRQFYTPKYCLGSDTVWQIQVLGQFKLRILSFLKVERTVSR